MPLKMAGRIQAGLPIANFANYAKLLKEFVFEQRVGNSLVVREPVGVIRVPQQVPAQVRLTERSEEELPLRASRHLPQQPSVTPG